MTAPNIKDQLGGGTRRQEQGSEQKVAESNIPWCGKEQKVKDQLDAGRR